MSNVCFFRNGDAAVAGPQVYVQCPGLTSCCLPTDTCVSNGLCRDVNNHVDGSLTSQNNGAGYNFTGLYQSPACVNADFTGCDLECTMSNSSSKAYIWACNDQLTDYCCANTLAQFDCCSGSSNFALASPTVVSRTSSASGSSTTTSSASSTSSTSVLNTTSALSTTTSAPDTTSSAAPSSSLSEGAKIGLGVGIAVGVLLIAGIVGMLAYVRRLKRQRSQGNVVPQADPDYPAGPGYPAAQEKFGPNQTFVAEADAGRPPAELEGSATGFK